jgi:hypothetical protein
VGVEHRYLDIVVGGFGILVFAIGAVRIDGQMKCTGRVPKVEEITGWLREKAAA